MRERLQSLMIAHGAAVFLVGLLAGFPFAFVLIQKIALWPVPGSIPVTPSPDASRAWRMAHMEGLLNGMLLIAVAAGLKRLVLSERALKLVAWGLVITAWGNELASLIGPIFGGRGLEFGAGVASNVMYLLFVAAILSVLTAMVLVCVGAARAYRQGAVTPDGASKPADPHVPREETPRAGAA
ncbi:MAG TPA: hypothetical protein VK447_06575 [Myxococcaceae bacterium]|nr:hypothetical protein [Myxococcaceae bacterium]